jgi:serine/threonine-protein kinase RsbW
MPEAQERIVIASTFEDVANLAERIEKMCSAVPGAEVDAIQSVRLCMAEAMNNIVEHAYGGHEGHQIQADIKLTASQYEVELVDEGEPMPGGVAPDGVDCFDETDLDALPEGGFGWMLIRSEMDAVDYQRCGERNVLRMQKKLTG